MQASLKRVGLALFILILASLVSLTASTPAAADPAPCADLLITDFTVSPAQPVQGQNATISITVRNQGTCPSLSFVVQWKSRQFASTGPSTYVGGLNANQSTVVTFNYAFPDAGNFTTVAEVDSDNTAPETNESNNIEILPVTVLEAAPDLTISDVNIVPAMPVQGITAKINIQIRNVGNVDAGPFVVQWKSHQIAPTGPSTQLSGLGAGQTTWVSFDYAFPNDGNFTTIAEVDTDRDVAESNEENNTFIQEVTVHIAAPDLVITGFSIVPVDPAPGYPLLPVEGLNAHINIWVTNQGNAPAGTFVVQWKSALNAPTGPSANVASLAAGQTTLVTFEYAFPNDGNFTTKATVDSDNTVDEFNESNNIDILSTTVQKAVIDLVLTKFEVEPAPGVPASIPPLPVKDRLSLVTIKIENQGNYPAGDFVVQWKPTAFSAPLSTQVNGLKYGKSTWVKFDYTYQFAGDFQTTATVDSTNKVREIDENNNSQTKPVTVEPQRPDLIITGFKFDPAEPVQGAEAVVSIKVLNRGNTDAGPFLVKWKPHPLAQPITSQVNSLGYNQSTVVKFYYTYYLPGEFTTTAEVDSTNWVFELIEDNNGETRQVIVQRAVADLIISDFQIGQGNCPGFPGYIPITHPPFVEPIVEQGADIKACIKVQNLGNSEVGPFMVEWNPDAWGLIVPSVHSLSSQVDSLGAGQEQWVFFDFVYPESGEFRTIAEVDAFNDIRETNEDNNLDILNVVVLPSGPDLTIGKMVIANKLLDSDLGPAEQCDLLLQDKRTQVSVATTFPPANLEQGRPALVCIQVENQGNRPAQEFMVEWNPDAWGLITPSPGTVSSQVAGLAAGQSTVVIFEFTYNQAGTFHTVAKADAFNNVAELNEANNLATLDLEVEAAGPDLVITSMSISPQSPVQGQSVNVAITVQNQGNRSAGPFIVEWNPDAWGLITPSPGTLSTQVNGLAPSQSANVNFQFTYHEHGEFRTIAKVDAFNDVDELNEANNMMIENVVVAPANIDLRIDSFTIDPWPPVRGSKATASITVRNYGNYPTGAFWVKWKPTGKESSSGPVVKVDGLQPFSYGPALNSTTVQLESVFRKAETYTSWAMVDFFDNVIETNENNNEANLEVTVEPRKTTVKVTFTQVNIRMNTEGGFDPDLEWLQAFFIIDKNGSCNRSITADMDWPIPNETININEDGFKCEFWAKNNAEKQAYTVNKVIETTIIESAPLIGLSAGLELDAGDWSLSSATGLGAADLAPENGGYAFFIHTARQRWGEGTHTITGQEGDCSNGECFDLTYKVEITAEPPPLATAAGGEELAPPEYVIFPIGLNQFIPIDAELPAGLVREQYRVYLPFVSR